MAAVRTVLTLVAVIGSAIGFAACRGGDGEATPTLPAPMATASASPSPATSQPTETSSVALEDEVAEAYLAHWVAYADAVLYLDISLVEDFAAGEELEAIRSEIEALRSDGVALRVVVEHDFVVASASESSAVVLDRIVNSSFYVDAETRQPETGDGTGDSIQQTAHLENVGGRWVVVRVAQQRSD